MRIETSILKSLIYDEQYTRKVLPFLKDEYFTDLNEKILFKTIKEFISKYNTNPTYETLCITLNASNLHENEYKTVFEILNQIHETKDDLCRLEWLIDESEKFCKNKAIYNGLVEAISIADGKDKNKDTGAIPKILSDALAVGFDTTVGQDYLDNSLTQFEYYHIVEKKLPLDIEYFNKITKGGLPPKTLNIFVAGCIDENTKVKIRIKNNENDWVEVETEIKNVKNYLIDNKIVEIDSPDGWVPVTTFVEKGRWIGYKVFFDNKYIVVNENHLFETKTGWEFAKNLIGECEILSRDGIYKKCIIEIDKKLYNIVDLQIGHENHRYYADGLSSHNTNVGKTLVKCHFASHFLTLGKNVLYITMEMSENEIAKRIDANLMNIPMDDLSKISQETYLKKREKISTTTKGKLIIKEYPTASASVSTFRLLLNELLLKKNFSPDVILIDYMNICMSSRLKMGTTVNSYTYIKSIAEELRGLAVEYNVPLITSSQLNRSGTSNSDPEFDDVSESHGTNMTADFIAALITTEELESMNQILVKQLKSRYSDKSINKRFIVGIDKSKSRLYDVEYSAQEDIVNSGQEPIKEVPTKRNFGDFKI
jgi:replicative DNA helicase